MTTSGLIRAVLATLAMATVVSMATPVLAQRDCAGRKTVRFGETAVQIARRCGVTVESLVRSNPGLRPGEIKAGERIAVPPPALAIPRLELRGNPAISGPPGQFRGVGR